LTTASGVSTRILRVATCGSVDDGKSTLVGRLLYETGSVPDDTLEAARKAGEKLGSQAPEGIDFSLLTDGLEAEREQGITIDVAYRSMTLGDGTRVLLADSPGHEQYTRNMAVAASTAEVGLVLVDAVKGVRQQTARHINILRLMGVSQILVAINKMDAAGWSQPRYEELVAEVKALDAGQLQFIAVSALIGDGITRPAGEHVEWWQGPSVLEYLESMAAPTPAENPFRMAVRLVQRVEGRRWIFGNASSPHYPTPGSEIVIQPSGVTARLLNVHANHTALALTLDGEFDVTRGDVLTSVNPSANAPQPADRFAAKLVWFDEQPLILSHGYLLVSESQESPITLTGLKWKLDVVTGQHLAASSLQLNEIGAVELAAHRKLSLSPQNASNPGSRNASGFLLVDRITKRTVAAGIIEHALRRSENITEHKLEITRADRERIKQQRGKLIWLTGLSGSGKSTIAVAVDSRLNQLGLHSYVLDGDNLRLGLNKDLGFTPTDRAENVRRVAEVAKLMVDAGLIVLVSLVSPFRQDRDDVRAMFAPEDFVEVFVDTPAEICAERDPKGLYKKANSGNLPNFTGVGQSYEPPLKPELKLDGTKPVAASLSLLMPLISPKDA
jgi:bifunctional enzyme CysN/CysC